MNDLTESLDIGLADFSEPTILILGGSKSLSWLADVIRRRLSLDLAAQPLVRLNRLSLTLKSEDCEGGLSQTNELFAWTISPTEADRFSEQLQMLASSNSPGHAYLDPASNGAGVQLLASKGEYKADEVFAPSPR